MPKNTDHPAHSIAVSALPQNRPHAFDIAPKDESLTKLAQTLNVSTLRKLTFKGKIRGQGKRDFILSADLGATVVQPCVQSLAPVTTRINSHVERRYVADWALSQEPGSETEMPLDVASEPLGSEIDLWAVMVESLALEIPDYPRAEDAPPLGEYVITEPGRAAMRDDDAKPFAGLAGLFDKPDKSKDDN